MVRLYKVHKNGKLGTWEIYSVGQEIYMVSQTVWPEGARTEATERIESGRAGRTIEQQIELRINARIRSKMDGGYKRTEAEAWASSAPTNQLDMPIPMTAQSNAKHLSDTRKIFYQPKLDGMRLIITCKNDVVFAYTRRGKMLETVGHLLGDAAEILDEGEYLDGELYHHGANLQTIMSWAKRGQEHTKDLKFHCFDMMGDRPFKMRTRTLRDRIAQVASPNIVYVPTDTLSPSENIVKLLDKTIAKGYEGLILRNGDAPYQAGTRSYDLVKVKKFLDKEFIVTDVTTGALGMPVLVCKTEKGYSFRVTAPGTHGEKAFALDNPELFVGKPVTVKYSGLTSAGVPFHPVCMGLRKD